MNIRRGFCSDDRIGGGGGEFFRHFTSEYEFLCHFVDGESESCACGNVDGKRATRAREWMDARGACEAQDERDGENSFQSPSHIRFSGNTGGKPPRRGQFWGSSQMTPPPPKPKGRSPALAGAGQRGCPSLTSLSVLLGLHRVRRAAAAAPSH